MVELVYVGREDWRHFLKVIDLREDEDIHSPTVYLLHRALGSKERVKGGYMLYPITGAERETILDALV